MAKLKQNARENDTSRELILRINLTLGILDKGLDNLETEVKNEVVSYAVKTNNWIKDRESLCLFKDTMTLLNPIILSKLMMKIVYRYKSADTFPIEVQENVAFICTKYLYICKKKNRKVDKEVIDAVIEFLETLSDLPNLIFSKILAHYFRSYFEGNMKEVKEIEILLKKSHCSDFLIKLEEDKL